MAYRKLGKETRIRRSILAGLTKDVIMHESVVTTEARAKEVRKFVDKMITYGKKGTLVSRRKALAFLHNDNEVVSKVFNDLAKRYENRNGGYTRIIKLGTRPGDSADMCLMELVDYNEVYTNAKSAPKAQKATRRGGKKKSESTETEAPKAE